MSDKLKINAIYCATEGEGIFVGTPQVFVRFQGCDVGCKNCDSKYTWNAKNTPSFSLDAVMESVYGEGYEGKIRRVSITGGDPLHQDNISSVIALAKALKMEGYYINVEASGTYVNSELFDRVDFISFDFKTPSTGVKVSIDPILEMAKLYPKKFQVKSVVENIIDFEAVLDAYSEVEKSLGKVKFTWCLTPAYNLQEGLPQERFEEIFKWNQELGGTFRVICQQHKLVFGPKRERI